MADHRLRVLTGVVEGFRNQRGDMPMQMAHVLLAVAARPGVTIGALVNHLGVSQTAVSRNVQMLSDGDSKGTPGMGLISVQISSKDFRVKELYLSTEGRAYLRKMLSIAGSDAATTRGTSRLPKDELPLSTPQVTPSSKSPWAAL
jgi:DNA-binding MarR family transcriptional regulator